jgi:RimJ/RimL family protein N-acetyltransferase
VIVLAGARVRLRPLRSEEFEGLRAAGGVFGIGIEVFEQDHRGKGYGTEVVAMLVRHLFDRDEAWRVEGGTTPENAAMRRVFGLGFVEEGVQRQCVPAADGGGADCVMYGMTRNDYEGVRDRRIRTS